LTPAPDVVRDDLIDDDMGADKLMDVGSATAEASTLLRSERKDGESSYVANARRSEPL
jgi:hypothetical protein